MEWRILRRMFNKSTKKFKIPSAAKWWNVSDLNWNKNLSSLPKWWWRSTCWRREIIQKYEKKKKKTTQRLFDTDYLHTISIHPIWMETHLENRQSVRDIYGTEGRGHISYIFPNSAHASGMAHHRLLLFLRLLFHFNLPFFTHKNLRRSMHRRMQRQSNSLLFFFCISNSIEFHHSLGNFNVCIDPRTKDMKRTPKME